MVYYLEFHLSKIHLHFDVKFLGLVNLIYLVESQHEDWNLGKIQRHWFCRDILHQHKKICNHSLPNSVKSCWKNLCNRRNQNYFVIMNYLHVFSINSSKTNRKLSPFFRFFGNLFPFFFCWRYLQVFLVKCLVDYIANLRNKFSNKGFVYTKLTYGFKHKYIYAIST